MYIITKLLAPATSKMTNRGGGKGYTLTRREKPIDQVLIALQFYASVGLLQVHLVVGDTTGGGKSTVSLAVHDTDAMLKTIHNAYSRKIALWDTNCRLARHCKWFLHHVLTVNQGLTNLSSNQALNNVLKSSD